MTTPPAATPSSSATSRSVTARCPASSATATSPSCWPPPAALPSLFDRVCVEVLARTGLRKGEFLRLSTDAVVRIGDRDWLHVPVGKLHSDRYIPLHPRVKTLLSQWLDHRGAQPGTLMFTEHGRPIPQTRIDAAVRRAASAAGIGHVTPHQLRHSLATQAINRGMSLEAIAALLGHTSMSMTLTYARISDRTVADEYFSVTQQVEALYDTAQTLPADAAGPNMQRLHAEASRRLLGNGYCTRPTRTRLPLRNDLRNLHLLHNHHRIPRPSQSPAQRRTTPQRHRPPGHLPQDPRHARRHRYLTKITRISRCFFQERVFLLQLPYPSFQFVQPRPVRHVQRQLFPRMLPPVSLNPVAKRRLVYPDLPRHLSDRPRTVNDQPGSFFAEFGRIFLAFPRHPFPVLSGKNLMDPDPESSGRPHHPWPGRIRGGALTCTVLLACSMKNRT